RAAAAGEPARERRQQVVVPDQHLIGANPGGPLRGAELGGGLGSGAIRPGRVGEPEHEERRAARWRIPRLLGLPGIGGEAATGEINRAYLYPAAGRDGRDVGGPVGANP